MWRWSLNGTGTRVHSEHPAMDQGLMRRDPGSGGLYYHVQDITLSEIAPVTSVGLARNLGLELVTPLRTVATRVRYQDAERRPFVPSDGDIHHRNETLVGSGDPWVLLHLARPGRDWTVAARLGLSVPLGRTEPNPFELGRQGLPHQHIQFGTGTWDPLVGLGAGRRLGSLGVSLLGLARLSLLENKHGYQAGHRYQASLLGDRPLAGAWRVSSGLELVHENAERWSGRKHEEEGNLGRTDLLLTLALLRSVSGLGGLRVAVSVPILTRAAGAQLDYPVILSVGLAR